MKITVGQRWRFTYGNNNYYDFIVEITSLNRNYFLTEIVFSINPNYKLKQICRFRKIDIIGNKLNWKLLKNQDKMAE